MICKSCSIFLQSTVLNLSKRGELSWPGRECLTRNTVCDIVTTMQPNKKFVTINRNKSRIIELLQELVFQPRLKAIEWSKITLQTPNIKIGYPGQHLASLITGMPGERTGARGNDIIDGTEVKSCSRIDPLDRCNSCKLPVARLENECQHCGSANILRSNDSKWLIGIRNEDNLETLLHEVKRVLFIIGYYPNFSESDFDVARITAYEIWPESNRQKRFGEIMTNYYKKIYLAHKKIDSNKSPAPKNFWPFSYQFYLCNPIEVFSCDVTDINVFPKIKITDYVSPTENRNNISSVNMPSDIITLDEINLLFSKAKPDEIKECLKKGATLKDFKKAIDEENKNLIQELLPSINENLKNYLPLRDTDKIAVAHTKYQRRKH